MSKPVKPGAGEAAEYVLGLLGKEDSRAFALRLKSDEALRAEVEYWESMFSDLPAEAAEANWFEISPGIKGRLLHVDRAQNRRYLLIRMAPGASYHPHSHDTDEQSLVLEGDLSFGELNLKAGDFHVATPSSSHPPGRTVNGCLVHVVMSLDQR
jgi:anti-sigma factor ChrR (cupin superfamily)